MTVLKQVLTNSTLRSAVHDATSAAPVAEVAPNRSAWPGEVVGRACEWTRGKVGEVVESGVRVADRACSWTRSRLAQVVESGARMVGHVLALRPIVQAAWGVVRHNRNRLLAACGIGATVGVVTYYAGPWLGVAAASVGGFCTTLACMARNGIARFVTATLATD